MNPVTWSEIQKESLQPGPNTRQGSLAPCWRQRRCEAHSDLKAPPGPAWGTASRPPAARRHLCICTGTGDDTTMKQFTSWGRWVPDVLQHISTSFTTERVAGTCSWEQGPPSNTAACTSGFNIAPVKLQFHSYSWLVLLHISSYDLQRWWQRKKLIPPLQTFFLIAMFSLHRNSFCNLDPSTMNHHLCYPLCSAHTYQKITG